MTGFKKTWPQALKFYLCVRTNNQILVIISKILNRRTVLDWKEDKTMSLILYLHNRFSAMEAWRFTRGICYGVCNVSECMCTWVGGFDVYVFVGSRWRILTNYEFLGLRYSCWLHELGTRMTSRIGSHKRSNILPEAMARREHPFPRFFTWIWLSHGDFSCSTWTVRI